MNEYEMIRTIAAAFPRSRDQLNGLFECDAELVRIGDGVWGLTMDDFSPDEDLFTSEDPRLLGSNLAVATLSDLFAAGVEPRFFMHALSLPQKPDGLFVDGLVQGIRGVLGRAGCALCGGDLGRAGGWRYCGFAMGRVAAKEPLTRRLPARAQLLWVTGELGDANLAALRKTPTPAFQLRMKEAEEIRRHATGCIDTSGGFMEAVWMLHAINPGLCIKIHVERLPLAPGLADFAAIAGVPPEAGLLGGAGEYELLFATPADIGYAARELFARLGIACVGEVAEEDQPGLFICRAGRTIAQMTAPPPSPRSTGTAAEHVEDVVRAANALFAGRSD